MYNFTLQRCIHCDLHALDAATGIILIFISYQTHSVGKVVGEEVVRTLSLSHIQVGRSEPWADSNPALTSSD